MPSSGLPALGAIAALKGFMYKPKVAPEAPILQIQAYDQQNYHFIQTHQRSGIIHSGTSRSRL
jgi:hypothetical protein